jgi:hypothetical protein
MGGACGTKGGEEKYINRLMGKPEGQRPFERLRHRWDYNIKMDFKQGTEPRKDLCEV